MFAYIKGSLEEKSSNYVVIDVGGIGYKIFMSDIAINTIGDIGNIVLNKTQGPASNHSSFSFVVLSDLLILL